MRRAEPGSRLGSQRRRRGSGETLGRADIGIYVRPELFCIYYDEILSFLLFVYSQLYLYHLVESNNYE